MPESVVDLRSDTVTRPTARMRQAMVEAEVGDDVFIEDPTVNRLQDRAAEIFGREAGLFVPSGTMGNLTSILAQTERGQEVICEAQGHIYNYEMASMASIAGVLPRVIETRPMAFWTGIVWSGPFGRTFITAPRLRWFRSRTHTTWPAGRSILLKLPTRSATGRTNAG